MGWRFSFWFFFFSFPSHSFGCWCFQTQQSLRVGRLAFSRTLLCCVDAFRPEECVRQPVSSQPRHRKQFGITPTFKTSCWQAQGVTSDAFHTSPIGGPVLPFGKQDLLSGRAGRGGHFPAKCTEEGGEVCQVLRVAS